MLKLKNICVKAGQQKLLKGVSFDVAPGSISVLLGASGAGKTTLLRVLAQLMPPYDGEVLLSSKNVADLLGVDRAQTVGFVPQGFALFPQLTVEEQCCHPLVNVLKMDPETALRKVEHVLDRLGMRSYAQRYPFQLSGGQQQRVALARFFCMDTKIFLLDEPTSALDPANSAIVAAMLKELAARGKTIILSTQDMAFAQAVCTQAVFLKEGEIVEVVEDSIAERIYKFSSEHGDLGA